MRVPASSVADVVAALAPRDHALPVTLVVPSEHLPAIATDRFVGGDSGQLLRRPVPRDDREVGVEGVDRCAGDHGQDDDPVREHQPIPSVAEL